MTLAPAPANRRPASAGTKGPDRVVWWVMDAASEDEFAAYAQVRWPALVRSAVLLGCTAADAEDLAQTVLLRAWTHWGRVRSAREPDAYVYRMLVNALATSRRRRWWGERPSEHGLDAAVSDRTCEVDARDAIVRALASLPREQQMVLVLRFVADLSERATAEALGLAAGTVKSRTSRALAALDSSDLVQEDL